VTTTTAVNTSIPFLLLPGTNNTVKLVCTDNASPPHSYLSYILVDEFSDMMGCQRAGRLGRVFWRRISVPVTSVRPAVASVPLYSGGPQQE
jgi:hypothetical protein